MLFIVNVLAMYVVVSLWQHDTNNATVVYEEASQIQSTGKVMINRMLLRRRPLMLILRLHIRKIARIML
jgi:hypothetical protein